LQLMWLAIFINQRYSCPDCTHFISFFCSSTNFKVKGYSLYHKKQKAPLNKMLLCLF
jgi:hypothetical protein